MASLLNKALVGCGIRTPPPSSNSPQVASSGNTDHKSDMNSTTKSKKSNTTIKDQARSKKNNTINVVPTTYTSLPVSIPESFLTDPLPSPPTITPINFSTSTLPEYAPHYATVLDNVLTPEECATFLSLVEQSSATGWVPAMVNGGPGYEFLATDYRNSDRIIWDEKEVVRRIWERCKQAPGLAEQLSEVKGDEAVARDMFSWRQKERGEVWTCVGLNERMRCLKYGSGQFFKEHCDGAYSVPDGSQRTFYTVHLYLNDSVQTLRKEGRDEGFAECNGGATTFWSDDLKRRLDVDPKAGRVLIFQHRKLLHSGDTVIDGIKYTMRTDLLFKLGFEEE